MARQPQRATAEQDAKLLQELHDFLSAPKSLAAPIRWTVDHPDLIFVVTLDIEGVTEPGFHLRGRGTLALPDQDISLQLVRTTLGRKGQNFERLDWRPIHDHRNRRHPDPDLSFCHLTGSHHHRLADNAAHPWGLHCALRDNLPIATPLRADPPGWPELAALAGRLWAIEGLGDAPAPPWQSDLAALRGRTP
jgi:hypothetical protein